MYDNYILSLRGQILFVDYFFGGVWPRVDKKNHTLNVKMAIIVHSLNIHKIKCEPLQNELREEPGDQK